MKLINALLIALLLTFSGIVSHAQSKYSNTNGDKWSLYRDKTDSTYYIMDENMHYLLKGLRYAEVLDRVESVNDDGTRHLYYEELVQVLNNKNKIQYIETKTWKVIPETHIEKYNVLRCGNEVHISRYIQKGDSAFKVYEVVDYRFVNGDTTKKTKLLFAIAFKNADDVQFLDQHYSPYLVYRKNDKYGVWRITGRGEGRVTEAIYDGISYSKNTKLKRDNLYTYLEMKNEPKYAELGTMEFGLARMRLKDGRTGYVNIRGEEFYDK